VVGQEKEQGSFGSGNDNLVFFCAHFVSYVLLRFQHLYLRTTITWWDLRELHWFVWSVYHLEFLFFMIILSKQKSVKKKIYHMKDCIQIEGPIQCACNLRFERFSCEKVDDGVSRVGDKLIIESKVRVKVRKELTQSPSSLA
jgi:hypothetical protein